MKSKLINVLQYSLIFIIFAFFNSMMMMFSFIYTYLRFFIYEGENPIIKMFILLIPHIALVVLNVGFIYWLRTELKLNKLFYRTIQAIAIIIFMLAFVVLSLDVYVAYTSPIISLELRY